MLAERLALLAARHGVDLAPAAGATRLGLAGTIRVLEPIPLRFTSKAREQLAGASDRRGSGARSRMGKMGAKPVSRLD